MSLTQASNDVPGFQPTGISLNQPVAQATTDFRVVGKQSGANGLKVRYFGGGNGDPISGALDYQHTGNGTSYDQSLCLGPYPYGAYTCANVPGSGKRQLAILYTQTNATNPTVSVSDAAIAPSSAVFGGNLILVAGTDNNASAAGAAKASAYSINPVSHDVGVVFTGNFVNTLSNHVFTSHSLVWGAQSSTFNILVDNQTVHNGNNNTFSYNYTLYAYDGTGNQLWTSSPRSGTVLKISVGSSKSIYVLGTHAPGQFLVSFGTNGVLRWSRSTQATRIASALDQGVVVGDSAIDGSGHHHVHLTKYSISGPVAWTQTYASQPTNDDTLTDLQWISGHIFIAGEVTPTTGNRGIFGAQFDQTP